MGIFYALVGVWSSRRFSSLPSSTPNYKYKTYHLPGGDVRLVPKNLFFFFFFRGFIGRAFFLTVFLRPLHLPSGFISFNTVEAGQRRPQLKPPTPPCKVLNLPSFSLIRSLFARHWFHGFCFVGRVPPEFPLFNNFQFTPRFIYPLRLICPRLFLPFQTLEAGLRFIPLF